MASKFLLKEMDDTPPQILFRSTSFNPTGANDLRKGTPTEGLLVLINFVDGTAVQSAKIDLGALFSERISLKAVIEMQIAVADPGSEVRFFWAPSSSETPGVGNPGGVTGVAGAYSGYSSDLDDALGQLIPIGSMNMTDDAVDSIQTGVIRGELFPTERYGSLIVVNNTGETICDTDDIEAHVVLNMVIPEGQ